MLFQDELNLLLKPGYEPLETGFYRLPNGQMYIATLTPMPGCKGDWIDWWFGTGLRDSNTYKKWNPKSHIFYKWDEKWKPGHYIGASHYGELAMGEKIFKFNLTYNDPTKYFDPSRFDGAHIKTIFCGEGFTVDGIPNFRVVRIVRDTDYGCEVKTRFWNNDCTEEMAQARLEYSINSMAMLADSLKTLIRVPEKVERNSNICCKFCQSNLVVRNGWRKNTQYYLCKTCGHGFTNNQALPKMKYPVHTIASAVSNYYDGSSLNQICGEIEQSFNILPSYSTVYGWIKKLTEKALNEELHCKPIVGNSWVLYQTSTRMNDRIFRLTTVFDLETRFILALKLSGIMNKGIIQSLMLAAAQKAGKIPEEILTNADIECLEVIKSTFRSNSKFIRVTSITGQESCTDFMRNWHMKVKDRLKPKFDIDVDSSPQIMLDGFAFHYNYISLSDGNDKVPALRAKIQYPIGDWMDIIRSYSF
jgi:transposase-like protein